MDEELTNYCFTIAEQMVEALSKASPEFRYEFNRMLNNTYTGWEQDKDNFWSRYTLAGDAVTVSDGEDVQAEQLKIEADQQLIDTNCILLDRI